MSNFQNDYFEDEGSKLRDTLEDDEIVSFEKVVGRDVGILRIAGFFSMRSVFSDKIAKATKWETTFLTVGMLNVLGIISSQFGAVVTRWNDDRNYAFSALTAVLSGGLCFVKGWRLCTWREELRKILRQLAIMWEDSQNRDRIRMENNGTALGTYSVCKCYIIMVGSLCASYALQPYMLLVHYHWLNKDTNVSYDYSITASPATYPRFFRADTIGRYIICVSWEQFAITFIALYWICSDVIFAQLTTHTAIQFRVLCHDLEYIAHNDDDCDPKNEEKVVRRLSSVAKRHRQLYTYCEIIERMYNPIIFLTMLLTGGNLCFCAFRLQKELADGNWEEVFKNVTHVLTLIIQAFIYCGYADRLTQQSSLMARAAWECQWMERSNGFKVLLQMIMMRSKGGFNCTAYGFFSVNLTQMTAIANTAGSYFTLLKTMT